MDQNEDKDEFLNAIESVEKKHKPKSKKKDKKERLITVKTINEYKSNEIAININNFLGKNIHKDAGEVLFGENLARVGEYYGLKSTPIIGLIISSIGLIVIGFRVMVNKKKAQGNVEGGNVNEL